MGNDYPTKNNIIQTEKTPESIEVMRSKQDPTTRSRRFCTTEPSSSIKLQNIRSAQMVCMLLHFQSAIGFIFSQYGHRYVVTVLGNDLHDPVIGQCDFGDFSAQSFELRHGQIAGKDGILFVNQVFGQDLSEFFCPARLYVISDKYIHDYTLRTHGRYGARESMWRSSANACSKIDDLMESLPFARVSVFDTHACSVACLPVCERRQTPLS